MIQKMATHDALTALPNRALFNETLVHAIAQAERHGRALALFFLDLDRFKNINDTLGHGIGDRVLQEVGRRLTAAVRASDLVRAPGRRRVRAAGGGLPATRADLSDIAGKILGAFGPTFTVDGQELALSASAGHLHVPRDGADAQTLLSNADIAMYRAKDQGRNRHCFYAAEPEPALAGAAVRSRPR